MREVTARLKDPLIAAEFARRAGDLDRLIPVLHPFYRNAGLSLLEIFRLPVWFARLLDELHGNYEEDRRNAEELETASRAALDALERRTAGPPP